MHYIHEDFFLLMLNASDGRISSKNRRVMPFGMAGAAMADLVQNGCVRIQDDQLIPTSCKLPLGNPVLEVALRTIVASSLNPTIDHILQCLVDQSALLEERVVANLLTQHIIHEESPYTVWFTSLKRHPITEPYARSWIQLRLRNAVLVGKPANPGTLSLLGILDALDRLPLILNGYEMRFAHNWTKPLIAGDPISQSIRRFTHVQKVEIAPAPAI